jgi:hypothetical protein
MRAGQLIGLDAYDGRPPDPVTQSSPCRGDIGLRHGRPRARSWHGSQTHVPRAAIAWISIFAPNGRAPAWNVNRAGAVEMSGNCRRHQALRSP